MSWTDTFVMYRPTPQGGLTAVFQTSDFKKAQYWMKFIAQVGDVCCRTPTHPKHTKGTQLAEYWCHKEASGAPATSEDAWKTIAQSLKCEPEFPPAERSQAPKE